MRKLIKLLIRLLVLLVVVHIANLIVAELGLPPTVKTIVYLILGLVFLFWLVDTLGIYTFAL